MTGKLFTRIRLKRLQLPGLRYKKKLNWLRFTVRYSLIRYLRNGGGTLQIKTKSGELVLFFIGDRVEIEKKAQAHQHLGLAETGDSISETH
jgi:hypothetical protein